MSTAPAHDRLGHLISGQAPPSFNGIDFVEIVGGDRSRLRVHFLNTAPVQGTLSASPPVTICGGQAGAIAVAPVDESQAWSADEDGRPVLSLAVVAPTDSSIYTLTLFSTVLDPYFDSVQFSFDASSTSQLDCQAPASELPPPPGGAPPINYLVKDFGGFKQALLDFSALRYPQWVERSEADLGMMLIEALSAIGDELSYLQDRVAGEATLGTASQRLSLMRHARLVDYDPSPAIAATTTLQVDVAPGVTALRSGLRCSAAGPDGQRIPFELGAALADSNSGQLLSASYAVDPRWNAGPTEDRNLNPYWWDVSRQKLPAGSARLWLIGQGLGLGPGQQLLIDTAGADSADPPVREIVTIDQVVDDSDDVFGVALTRIDLQAPTTLDHDLGLTHLAGNLLPAMQGARATETFAIPEDVVVRTAPNWTPEDPRPEYRYTLAAAQVSWLPAASAAYLPALAPPMGLSATAGDSGGSLATGTYAYQVTAVNANGETTALAPVTAQVTGPAGAVNLAWTSVQATATYNVYGRTGGSIGLLARAGPFPEGRGSFTDTGSAAVDRGAIPPAANTTAGVGPSTQDTDLSAQVAAVPQIALVSVNPEASWQWERWLLGSGPADTVFTLTPERYSMVGAQGSRRWFDYDGEGTTIRFGDGVFGLTPTLDTTFTTTYLAGGGGAGNVPADTIAEIEPGDPQGSLVLAVTNPFAAIGGADEETPQQIRDRAPQAFAANPLRLVLADDYAQAAQSLPWVMQAGAAFRWTGSWLTVFTTADPLATETLTTAELSQLSDLLDRRRLAGYESYVLAPSYVSLDLEVVVQAQPTAFAGDVQAAVLAALRPGLLPDGTTGFFDHSRWSFGRALESSALVAAVQRVAGVLGVTAINYRQRGLQPGMVALPETLSFPADQILRVDDDPSVPEAGSLQVMVQGGK